MRVRIKDTYENVAVRGKTGTIVLQIGPVVRILLDDGSYWMLSPSDFDVVGATNVDGKGN
jgi:hypothetical protein